MDDREALARKHSRGDGLSSPCFSCMLKEVATIKLAEHEVQIRGYPFYYQVVGEGEPLILIHGLSGSSRWWIRNVPALAEHYRVYLLDLPGFGSMRRFPRRFILDEAASWIPLWMEAAGVKRASFIGHSMGGYICLWLAAHRPELVQCLVLVSPAGIPRVRSILGYAVPLLVALRYLTPSFFLVLLYDALRAGPLTLLRAAQDLLTKDIRDYLKFVRVPTLLIWGLHDSLVPPILGDILRQEIVNSRLLILKKGRKVQARVPSPSRTPLVAYFSGPLTSLQAGGRHVEVRNEEGQRA